MVTFVTNLLPNLIPQSSPYVDISGWVLPWRLPLDLKVSPLLCSRVHYHFILKEKHIHTHMHPGHPLDKGRGGALRFPKKCFRPFGPQFNLKIKRWGRAWAPPPDPPLVYTGECNVRDLQCKTCLLSDIPLPLLPEARVSQNLHLVHP